MLRAARAALVALAVREAVRHEERAQHMQCGEQAQHMRHDERVRHLQLFGLEKQKRAISAEVFDETESQRD